MYFWRQRKNKGFTGVFGSLCRTIRQRLWLPNSLGFCCPHVKASRDPNFQTKPVPQVYIWKWISPRLSGVAAFTCKNSQALSISWRHHQKKIILHTAENLASQKKHFVGNNKCLWIWRWERLRDLRFETWVDLQIHLPRPGVYWKCYRLTSSQEIRLCGHKTGEMSKEPFWHVWRKQKSCISASAHRHADTKRIQILSFDRR